MLYMKKMISQKKNTSNRKKVVYVVYLTVKQKVCDFMETVKFHANVLIMMVIMYFYDIMFPLIVLN